MEEVKTPTKEEVLSYYASNNEVLRARCEFSELNARIKKADFEGFEAEIKLIHLQDALKQREEPKKKVLKPIK